MKRLFPSMALALVLMFTTGALAADIMSFNSPFPPFIEGTIWNGKVTVVNTSGDPQENVDAVLTITKQFDDFFQAKLVLTPGKTFDLSGIIGPMKDRYLKMTGVGILVNGEIFKTKKPKKIKMNVRGRNVDDGSMFIGTLELQQN